MVKRAGGQIIKGKRYFWTNFYIDELYFDEPFFKNPCYTVPDEWVLEIMFDDRCSALLMPMPVENWN